MHVPLWVGLVDVRSEGDGVVPREGRGNGGSRACR